MPVFIRPADLHPGDVFLYHGEGVVSSLIRLFDGTEYSHASLWTGNEVIEAIGEGVVGRPLKVSIADAKFVDVYRYRNKDTGLTLGDDASPLPATPALTQAAQFKKDHDRYAYEALLLLALLASTRQITAPVPLLGMILRVLLDNAADVLARLIAAGKEPMICSELVYRCFTQAGPKYDIRIRGADMAVSTAANTMGAAPGLAPDPQGYQEAAANFLENYQAAKHAGKPNEFALGADGQPNLGAVADFVTPGDLKKSPDLQLLGTLQA